MGWTFDDDPRPKPRCRAGNVGVLLVFVGGDVMNDMTREEELSLIDEAVAAGKCKRYPPGASSDAQSPYEKAMVSARRSAAERTWNSARFAMISRRIDGVGA